LEFNDEEVTSVSGRRKVVSHGAYLLWFKAKGTGTFFGKETSRYRQNVFEDIEGSQESHVQTQEAPQNSENFQAISSEAANRTVSKSTEKEAPFLKTKDVASESASDTVCFCFLSQTS